MHCTEIAMLHRGGLHWTLARIHSLHVNISYTKGLAGKTHEIKRETRVLCPTKYMDEAVKQVLFYSRANVNLLYINKKAPSFLFTKFLQFYVRHETTSFV
jgi:hypothetical protein